MIRGMLALLLPLLLAGRAAAAPDIQATLTGEGTRMQRGSGLRASPNFMGLASFGLEIGIFWVFSHGNLLLSTIWGLG